MRISKKPLSEKMLIKIYKLFFEVISRFNDQTDFYEIFNDILYLTEKIMIAKRVAIIYLLIKGINQDDIADTLKVSSATVSRYYALFYQKESKIIQILKTMVTKENTLGFLDDAFGDLFIQPGVRIGHWQLYWDRIRKKQEKERGL